MNFCGIMTRLLRAHALEIWSLAEWRGKLVINKQVVVLCDNLSQAIQISGAADKIYAAAHWKPAQLRSPLQLRRGAWAKNLHVVVFAARTICIWLDEGIERRAMQAARRSIARRVWLDCLGLVNRPNKRARLLGSGLPMTGILDQQSCVGNLSFWTVSAALGLWFHFQIFNYTSQLAHQYLMNRNQEVLIF